MALKNSSVPFIYRNRFFKLSVQSLYILASSDYLRTKSLNIISFFFFLEFQNKKIKNTSLLILSNWFNKPDSWPSNYSIASRILHIYLKFIYLILLFIIHFLIDPQNRYTLISYFQHLSLMLIVVEVIFHYVLFPHRQILPPAYVTALPSILWANLNFQLSYISMPFFHLLIYFAG